MSPRVILQTNPLEHSAVANNCAIDVHGWAEPGTTLQINGRETPVAEDGLFLEQVPPSREGTITLEAAHGQSHKKLRAGVPLDARPTPPALVRLLPHFRIPHFRIHP